MSKVKIKNIEIKIGKETIELSLEQAKDLKGALDGLFPSRPQFVPVVYPDYIYQEPWQWLYTYTDGGTIPNDETISIKITA